MSKRHQSSRRKTYGRRQHEPESARTDHSTAHHGLLFELDDWGATAPSDPLSFLDPRAPRYRFAAGD